MRLGPAAALAATLLAALAFAGCASSLVAARVPDSLLTGSNGWAPDASHSQPQPASTDLGLVQRQTLAYVDDGKHGDGGYPANLAIATLKLFPAPSRDQLRDIVQQQVQQQSQASGIQLGNQVVQGGRTLADGHQTLYFVFTGTVTGQGQLFTTSNATAKILGEVWNCPESGTSVAAVGLAQVSSASSLGGVPLSTQENTQNWRELAADPSGSVDSQQGSDGLLYNTVCGR